MKLVTIQNKQALITLKNNKIFKSDFDYIVRSPFDEISESEELEESSKINAYQLLMKYYGYNSPPIFCCVVGRKTDFGNTKINKDSILLELEVPKEELNLHLYMDWLFLLNYAKRADIKADDLTNVFDSKKFASSDYTVSNLTIQAIIPCIKPEWLLGAYEVPKSIHYFYFFSKVFTEKYYENSVIYRP